MRMLSVKVVQGAERKEFKQEVKKGLWKRVEMLDRGRKDFKESVTWQ